MKKKITTIILLIVVIGFIFISAYKKTEKKDFFAMDTVISVSVKGFSAPKAVKEIEEEVQRLDREYSVNKEYALGNYNDGGEATEELSFILSACEEIKAETDGNFDAGIYPVTKLWGFTQEKFSVPQKEEIEKALMLCGTEYDLGAIAKGYAADKARDILKERKVNEAVIAFGGTVLIYGGKEKRVAIASPEGEGYAAYIAEDSGVISTSGGYERYFTENGEKYSHIMNPKTGYPAKSGIVSATVVMEDGMRSDAYSTAVFVMGEKKAREFWNKNSFGLIIITEDDRIIITEELDGKVSGINGKYKTEIWKHE